MLLLLLAAIAASGTFLAEGHCPGNRPCIRKCCPPGEMIRRSTCVPGGPGLEAPEGVEIIHAKPLCEMYQLEEEEEHTLNHNGTVSLDGVELEYCREWNHLNGTFTYVCFPPEDYEYTQHEKTLQVYSVGSFVSSPFLFATFFVYAFFRRLWNLHGHCVMIHSLCLLLAYLSLGFVQNGFFQEDGVCSVLGYAIQFFFMATFFWLNVMCFDIYWAFSGLKNLTGSVKERERKKLILYSCYAWGVPLFILLLTIGMDYSPYIPSDSIFKPAVGIDKCFFQKDVATGIYFYMPMGFVLVMNIILFSITAFRICTLRRETAVLKRGDSRKHDSTNDKERFSLYLKLFLVMGINWVMELVSYLAGGPSYIWYIPDFTNTLQGVFIFIIFVWKERVRRLVWAKITSCCGCKVVSSRSRGQWTTSTRNTSSLTNSSAITNNSIKMAPMPLTETNGNGITNGMSNVINYGINNDKNDVGNNVPPQGMA